MSRSPRLVTGGTGWLGSRLLEVLRDGLPELPVAEADRPVRCLTSSSGRQARAPEHVAVFEGDVRDPRSLAAFFRDGEGATVFHLAGVITPRRTRDFEEVNVDGTRNVLDAAIAAGASRFVAVSSSTAVGLNRDAERLLDERSPRRPELAYGRSKARMEDVIAERAAAGKIETVVLRPCRFYGPHQPANRTRFYGLIARGRLPLIGGGEARWSMSYLDNLCQGLLLAERSPVAPGRTYWIADRRPYTVRELVETVTRLLENEFGIRVPRRPPRLPKAVGRIAAAADAAFQSLGFVDPRVHAISRLATSSACSIAAAERDLGYDPKIDLEEGTRRALKWCLDNGERI